MIIGILEWIWILASILLIALELATATLILFPLALAALAGAVVAFLGGGIILQMIVALVVAVSSTIAFKPLANRLRGVEGEVFMGGSERLVGTSGRVLGELSPDSEGKVLVEGEEWRAELTRSAFLVDGDRILVVGIKGTKLQVIPFETPTN